jgi:protein-tyrosine phosphatase
VVHDEPVAVTGHFAPSRHVGLDGAVNVRDIGGYRSSYGTDVIRGRLYRGDSLSRLSDPDLHTLQALGLRTVIDFRTTGEILLTGSDRLPPELVPVTMPVTGGDLGGLLEIIASGDHELQQRELGDGRAASLMADINRGFVADPRQRETFGAALRLLGTPGQLPALYHCSSGKDRSGWMTAIILTILGVRRELVLRDYLLSNDFHRTGYQKLIYDLLKTRIVRDPELLRPVLEQSPTYLGAAFDEAERRYGSFGTFVTHGLGVGESGLGELRQALLGNLVRDLPALLAAAGAQAAQPEVGQQPEDQPEAGLEAHVVQPGSRRVVPQRVGDVAGGGRRDDVEVRGGRQRAVAPAGRG